MYELHWCMHKFLQNSVRPNMCYTFLMQGVQGSFLRDSYFNFWDEIENLHHWNPCFEARTRTSFSLSHTSRRKREFYRGLRNEIENFSHYILRFEIEKMFRPFSSPSSCRPASTGICSFTHIWGGPMLLFDWLRALNQTCFLNFRQYLGLLMLDKRKALIATKPTPSHHNSVASVSYVTFFKCSS